MSEKNTSEQPQWQDYKNSYARLRRFRAQLLAGFAALRSRGERSAALNAQRSAYSHSATRKPDNTKQRYIAAVSAMHESHCTRSLFSNVRMAFHLREKLRY